MPDFKDGKVFKSPKSLIKSPRFHEPLSSLIFTGSPTTRAYPEDDRISQDQILEEAVDIIVTEEKNVWITGLIFLIFSVSSWIISVQLLNNIMKKTSFDHPLFSSYFNGGMFILFGIKPLLADWKKGIQQTRNNNNSINNNNTENENESFIPHNNNNNSSYNSNNDNTSIFETPKVVLSHKEILIVSAFAALLYFGNCFLGSSALKYTTASNQTILATSSSVFSLVLGVILKFEKFTIGKLISVICSMLGILFITFASTVSNPMPIYSKSDFQFFISLTTENLGNILAIIGSLSYSGFLALFRAKLGEQTNTDSNSLVYGYMGFFTFVFGLPVLYIFNYFDWEHFTLPEDKIILLMVLLSSLLGTLSDYFASLASLITSPLTVSLSLSTAIPITMFLDSYYNEGVNFTFRYWIGIILIISSFVFTNIENQNEIVETAIENAIEEAINHDEQLSLLLSPHLSPYLSHHDTYVDIPGLSIDHNNNNNINDILDENEQEHQRLVVTGGQNHKYFFREINE